MTTSAMAHDLDITNKARQLGIAVGKTYSCVPTEERPIALADAEEMFDMIYFADGHEVAFVFAVGIGYGAGSEKNETDCTDLVEHVNAVKVEMGLRGSN